MFVHLEVQRNGVPEVPMAVLQTSLLLCLYCNTHTFEDFAIVDLEAIYLSTCFVSTVNDICLRTN